MNEPTLGYRGGGRTDASEAKRPETILDRLNRLENTGDERHAALQQELEMLLVRIRELENVVGVIPPVGEYPR